MPRRTVRRTCDTVEVDAARRSCRAPGRWPDLRHSAALEVESAYRTPLAAQRGLEVARPTSHMRRARSGFWRTADGSGRRPMSRFWTRRPPRGNRRAPWPPTAVDVAVDRAAITLPPAKSRARHWDATQWQSRNSSSRRRRDARRKWFSWRRRRSPRPALGRNRILWSGRIEPGLLAEKLIKCPIARLARWRAEKVPFATR